MTFRPTYMNRLKLKRVTPVILNVSWRILKFLKKDEKLRLRDDIDYSKIGGLSREMVAKLSKVKPATVGEASRIPGVTPAAITAVLGYVKR